MFTVDIHRKILFDRMLVMQAVYGNPDSNLTRICRSAVNNGFGDSIQILHNQRPGMLRGTGATNQLPQMLVIPHLLLVLAATGEDSF